MRQQCPNILEDAVTCSLEIETYLSLSSCGLRANDYHPVCHQSNDLQSSSMQYTSHIEYTSEMLHTLSKRVDKLNKAIGMLEECYRGEVSHAQISLASLNHVVQDEFHTAERASIGGYDKQTSKCSSGSIEDNVKVGSVESVSSDSKSESVKLLAVNSTNAYHITGLVN